MVRHRILGFAEGYPVFDESSAVLRHVLSDVLELVAGEWDELFGWRKFKIIGMMFVIFHTLLPFLLPHVLDVSNSPDVVVAGGVTPVLID